MMLAGIGWSSSFRSTYLRMSEDNHIQVLKNANQMTPSIKTATPVLITTSATTEGPVSAWRASLGVSMIMCFLIGVTLSLKF
jgi:hypothetical protein